MLFIGVDLGWTTGATGLAALRLEGSVLALEALALAHQHGEVLDWIMERTGDSCALLAIDAPTIIRNASGQRPAERELNAALRKFGLNCHPANLGRPFALKTTAFAEGLEAAGFRHAPTIEPRCPGRYQIEVFPHGSIVRFFGLDYRLRYKKGTAAERTAGLVRLRGHIASLCDADPPCMLPELPSVCDVKGRARKHVEDRLDAILCAYTGAHYWHWGRERSEVFGDSETGYIVVPRPASAAAAA